MIVDPVCGKRINRGKAHVVVEFDGVAYALCCPLCQKEFERAPKAYARPEAGRRLGHTSEERRRRRRGQ